MFTIDIPSHPTVSEVVFAYHPPTQDYHAQLVPKSYLHTPAVLAGTSLPKLIERVRARFGELPYIDPRLVRATEEWRPRAPQTKAA